MKILMITNSYVPNAGGVATSVHGWATALRDLGWSVLILTPEFSRQDESNEQVIRRPLATWDAIIANDFRIQTGTTLKQQIQKFAPDLIHIHGPFLLGPIATRLADAMAIPLLYTHHTKLEEFLHYSDVPVLTPAAVQAFYVGYANQCDALVVPSGVVERELTAMGVVRPVHIVPSGLSPGWYQDPCLEPPSGSRRTIGIIGRVTQEKHSTALVRAALRYMQQDACADLIVIGDGEALGQVCADAARLDLAHRVTCTGMLQPAEVLACLDRMDVVINAPDADTQCIVLLEAQARGVPVIASDVPVAREFICEIADGATFYPAQAWDELTGCLHRFFQLPLAVRVAAGNKVYAFAAGYSSFQMVHKLCAICENLACGTIPRHRDVLYGEVYRELTAALVQVIQRLRTP